MRASGFVCVLEFLHLGTRAMLVCECSISGHNNCFCASAFSCFDGKYKHLE